MLALAGEGRTRSSRFRVLDTASRISSDSSTIGVHSSQHPHGRVELSCSSRGGPGLMSVGTTPTSYLVSYNRYLGQQESPIQEKSPLHLLVLAGRKIATSTTLKLPRQLDFRRAATVARVRCTRNYSILVVSVQLGH
jgi:hypothetical protein